MKLGLKQIASAMLLSCGVAFSAGESSYYNIAGVQAVSGGFGWLQTVSYDMYLTQDKVPCTDNSWSMTLDGLVYRPSGGGAIAAYMGPYSSSTGRCFGSAEVSPENLYELVKTHWVDNLNSGNFGLGSDIDLGEISATEGKCNVNHKPLPYKSGKTFFGNDKTVSNLCYVSSSMTEPVGLFGTIVNTLMQDFTVEGVRMIVNGSSTDGAKYYPVGSIAGKTELVTLENVKIADVSIDAPFAGGAVGLVLNSTIKELTSSGKISISNSQPISTGYAGSKEADLLSPYRVFLGGIAGVTIRDDGSSSATLEDNAVSVSVQNKAKGVSSAVGGAIGFSFASLDSFKKIDVTAVGDGISGGSAMGGLIGYSSMLYTNNSPITADTCVVKLDQGTFKGRIGGASSPDMIAVGGLVGRDSLWARTKFEIVNSTADITFTDELNSAGEYVYFAGGLLGYGNNCLSSDRPTDFLVIEKSKSAGSMTFAASDVAVKGLHVKTFMGGIVGAACLAMEPRGFKENSSSVVLTSKAKTTGDSVSIGGMIGSMNVAGAKGVTLSNLEYTGKIVIEDSLGEIYAGGIVGQFREANGGKSIRFKDVYAKAQDVLIDYKAKADSKPAGVAVKGTRIGGLCAFCKETGLIEKVGISGSISVDGDSRFVGDSLFVGGIMARADNPSVDFVLQKTYTVGDISVTGTAARKHVGYLIGVGVMGSDSKYGFRSNYHYGDDDVDAFGYFSTTDTYGEGIAAGWMDNENMSYNIRNGAANTKDANAYRNGTEVASAMQTRSFAGVMNGALAGTKDDPYVWCYQTGTNNNLPYVTLKNSTPVSPADVVTYTVNFLDYDEKTLLSQPQTVPENSDAVEPDAPTREGYTFVGWDKSFSMVSSDLDVVAQYEINTYDVIFYLADSITPLAGYYDEKIAYGTKIAGPSGSDYKKLLEKEGFDFAGWSDSSYLRGVTSDMKIYPRYKEKSFTLTLLDDEGREIESEAVPFGAGISLPASVAKESTAEFSYEFESWSALEGEIIPETMPARDVIIVANFVATKRSYSVVFLDNNDDQIEDEQLVEYGESAVAPAAPAVAGRVFVRWDDSSYVDVVKNLEIHAVYDTATYVVKFFDFDGNQIGKTQTVVYEESAVEVAIPVSEGRVFKGWSETSFDKVVENLEIKALYDTAKFAVNFYDFDGKLIDKSQEVVYGAVATVPEIPLGEGRVFKGWSDSTFNSVTKALEIKALYDTATYVVKFFDFEGNQIGKAQTVVYEESAVEVAAPVSEGRVFTGWSETSFDKVVKDLEIKALYDTAKFAVNFYDFDGNLIDLSQEVVYGADAIVPESPTGEGRVFTGWSDSSFTGVMRDMDVYAYYDTVFFRVTFLDYNGDTIMSDFFKYHADMSVASALERKDSENYRYTFKEWTPKLGPLTQDMTVRPVYDSTYIGSSSSSVEESSSSIYVDPEIVMAPRSWNMISIGLMEQAGYPDHDGVYYWWDEEDPIGDYWQYKAYTSGEFEASRGYWFGTTEGATIPMVEPVVDENAEIVWKLDNKYSGWNMVANPYGWYVELDGSTDDGEEVEFWRWDADSSNYVIPKIIRPYEAVWAKVKKSTTWRMAATPVRVTDETVLSVAQKASALHKGALRKTSEKNWNVMVSLKDEFGKTDSWNMIGVGSREESMEKAPVGMGDYVRLAIAEGKMKLAKSIKSVAASYEWELLVAANSNRDGVLSFAGVEELNKQGLVMMVTVDGVTREVKPNSETMVSLKKDAKKVSVRVMPASAIVAADNSLKGLAALQNDGSLQFGFDAPESLAGSRGHYALVAVNGKVMSRGSFTAQAGRNGFSLSAPKAGLYVMQVQVGSQKASSKILVR